MVSTRLALDVGLFAQGAGTGPAVRFLHALCSDGVIRPLGEGHGLGWL